MGWEGSGNGEGVFWEEIGGGLDLGGGGVGVR